MFLLAVTCALLTAQSWATTVILDDSVTDLSTVSGEWTEWLTNPSMMRAYGDFQSVYNWRTFYNEDVGECKMWCEEPVAVEYKVASGAPAGAADCAYINEPDITDGFYYGFNCYNYKQYHSSCTRDECVAAGMYDADKSKSDKNCNVCPEFTVRYYCTGDKATQQANCNLDADKREQREHTRALLTQSSAAENERLISRDLGIQEQNDQRQELVAALREILFNGKK